VHLKYKCVTTTQNPAKITLALPKKNYGLGWQMPKEKYMNVVKKFLFAAFLVFGFSSLAGAQSFSLRGGLNLAFGSSVAVGADFGFRAMKVTKISEGLNFGIRSDIELQFSDPFAASITISPVLSFILAPNTLIYVGPTLGLNFGVATDFLLGADLGFEAFVSPDAKLYSDVMLFVLPAFTAFLDLGVEYAFTRQFGAYFEFQGSLGAAFVPGFGLGLYFKI
jgi:hypothetical protein